MKKIVFFCAILISMYSCKHEPLIVVPVTPVVNNQDTICDSNIVYFQNDILPLLQSSCATTGCHDNISHKEGVILNGFSNIITTGGVVAGNAFNSEIYQVLNQTGSNLMPPSSTGIVFSQSQKDLIKKWINQGAKNSICNNSSCDTTKFTFNTNVKPLLDASCVSCHSSTSTNGVKLDNYTNIKITVDNGKLLASIKHDPGTISMPQGSSKWADCKITVIQKWINAGALNN